MRARAVGLKGYIQYAKMRLEYPGKLQLLTPLQLQAAIQDYEKQVRDLRTEIRSIEGTSHTTKG